jgi:hypothetical protein
MILSVKNSNPRKLLRQEVIMMRMIEVSDVLKSE